MAKPTFFLSHSSADKNYLCMLKELLEEKTNNTLNIFLSSDGQSIRFGTNWIHSLETALKDASLMFVAISPNSIDSPWLYFEAGHAYSRGIEVVPIGIMGMEIALLPPPISLLQGFNITSEEGLNNIIAIINDKYDYKFEKDFMPNEYNDLKMLEMSNSGCAFRFATLIDHIETSLEQQLDFGDEKALLCVDIRDRVINTLDKVSVLYYPIDGGFIMHGIKINIIERPEYNRNERIISNINDKVKIFVFGNLKLDHFQAKR